MSGKQFASSAEKAASSSTAVPAAKLTQDQRVAAFFAQTSASAKASREVKKQQLQHSNTPTVINIDFLRSGREFLTLPTPPLMRQGVASSALKMTKAERLHEFYKATQANAIIALAAYSAKTQAYGSRDAVPTLVNMQFLRSGKEFESVPSSPSSSSSSSTTAMLNAAEGGAKMSHNARLEAFFKHTSASAVYTPPSARRRVQPAAPTAAPTLISPPTMVNLTFLRSGKEFFQTAHADRQLKMAKTAAADAQWRAPGPKMSRYARKLAFYKSTLKAAGIPTIKADAPSTPTMSPSLSGTVPTMVNLQFLRSGKEFFKQQASPTSSPTLAGSVPSPNFPTGPKKSRNARLEEFYTRTAGSTWPLPTKEPDAGQQGTDLSG